MGRDTYDAIISRVNVDGSLDTTFDGDGIVAVDFGWSDEDFKDVTVLPDGDLLAVGNAGTTSVWALARIEAGLDTCVARTGELHHPL